MLDIPHESKKRYMCSFKFIGDKIPEALKAIALATKMNSIDRNLC